VQIPPNAAGRRNFLKQPYNTRLFVLTAHRTYYTSRVSALSSERHHTFQNDPRQWSTPPWYHAGAHGNAVKITVWLAFTYIGENKGMNKAEIIEKMASEASISKTEATAALNSFVDSVTKTLKKKDGKVTLVGFGTFSKARRKARKGRNPQTGEAIKIKAGNVVKFRAGKKLKDSL
jgi:DNA-binding protein HU-beta